MSDLLLVCLQLYARLLQLLVLPADIIHHVSCLALLCHRQDVISYQLLQMQHKLSHLSS